jgi:sodium-dependent dicarboxylate transporter 2/3/5
MTDLVATPSRIDTSRWVAGLVGPLIFYVVWYHWTSYTPLGVLAWLSIYWAMGVVPIIYTAAIPILGFGLMGIPLPTILGSFVHPAMMLIVAPTLVIVAAVHCGLIERMSRFFIDRIGNSVRRHVIFWLVFGTIISDFAADVVIALAFTPIVVKMLFRAGYTTVEDIASSKSAMLLVIAVATGAGLGGILTPMAGGQAAITWSALNQVLGGEVTAWSYTLRMLLPTTVCLGIVTAVFCLLPISEKTFNFVARQELPSWSRHEKVVLVLFVLALGLPYLRPWLPISLPWIYTILMATTLLLYVPGVGMILPWRALAQFPLSAVSVWPIAMCVSQLTVIAGTGTLVLSLIGNFWAHDPLVSVGIWVLVCLGLAQVASDTGSAGMLIPIVQGALPAAGINPVPWIMMTGFSVDLSFMVPTATGTIGVLYALGGRSHWRLPLYGFVCALACGIFSWLFWSWVLISGATFWDTLEVIK